MNTLFNQWTHRDVKILDIRKLKGLYMIKVNVDEIESPLLIKDQIFNERLESFFIKSINNITRDEIMSLSFDMFITKDFRITVEHNGTIKKHEMPKNKWYVSFFEIPGELVSFSSIINKNK